MAVNLCTGSPVTAHAATSSSTYLLAKGLTEWRSLLDLSQFNPPLGTLDSVTIELSATLSGDGGVEDKQGWRSGDCPPLPVQPAPGPTGKSALPGVFNHHTI